MALYNNGYPATYPYMVQPQYQQPAQQNNSIIWIQGEAAAKSYLVAPNTSVALWDSESQTVYIKSADASGMPSMKVLDYTIRDNSQNKPHQPVSAPEIDITQYITRAEFETLTAQINGLKKKVERLNRKDEDDG
jgi:hypothetical protein